MIAGNRGTERTVELPDYLPARMLNEFVYCPRLFFYEWVEGVFAHNQETIEGAIRHRKLDAREGSLPSADELAASESFFHTRSIQLSSETHRLIAKLDVLEAADGLVTPVDYKRGSPRLGDATDKSAPLAWDPDRVQLAVQALVLRDNGYRCEEAIVYYSATKQRVRVPIDDALVRETLDALEAARALASSGPIPAALVDSPKCPKCSLVGICLPDETRSCGRWDERAPAHTQRYLFDPGPPPDAALATGESADDRVRRLVPARDDLRPLYLNTQGLHVGKSGNVLKIKEKDKLVQEVRINDVCQVNLFGGIQISTQAVQTLCENEVPIAYFSQGGWFYGITHGLGVKNVYLRRDQFAWADIPSFCLRLARALVAGKIRNQRTLLQRNHVEPPAAALAQLKCMQQDSERAGALDELLGIEGNAARIYFEHLPGMIKVGNGRRGEGESEDRRSDALGIDELAPGVSRPVVANQGPFRFDFERRNRRPPRDPVNALLSLAYSVLAKDLTIVCHAVGFDPFLGFYHQPRFGRAALALDLMEPFRPLIADSAVLSAINTRMVTPDHFVRVGESVSLTAEGRKAFFRAYEQRMDALATHPLFGYRVNYRRLLEIQARLLARVVTGELHTYPVFTTR